MSGEPQAVSPLRWRMISLAFFATMINYLDRQTLSVAAPILREQFHMSNEGYSRVVSAFLFAYTIMNGLSGPMIDRLGTRMGYGLCVAWWSVAAALHAFARGTLSLGIFRFLLGIGEAGNWPGAVKVVAEWFPEKERALAAGMFNSGSAVGAILAPPIVAYLILHFGWQSAFAFVGLAGLIWLAFWFTMYHTPKAAAGAPAEKVVPVRELLRTRFVWAFTFSKIFMDPVWYFYIFWFPEYLKHARGFDLAKIGIYGWIPFMVAGFGNILGGWMSGRLLRRGWSVTLARKSSVTFFAVLMTSAIPAVLAPEAWISIGARVHRDAGLHRLPGQHAELPGGRVPEECGGVGIRPGKHGLGLRRHAVHADHRLGSGALLVHSRVLRVRNTAADLRHDSVDAAGSAHAGT